MPNARSNTYLVFFNFHPSSTTVIITAGESHGPELTAIIEGLPAGLPLSSEEINRELARRQGGYGRGANFFRW
jgi:chorismate synthase